MRRLLKKYVKQAKLACGVGFDVFNNIWGNPDIVNFFANLPIDDNITRFMTGQIESATGGQGQILIIGGASGRLGRYTALNNPSMAVCEVDSSDSMVSSAHQLAEEVHLKNFESILGDALSLPFKEKSFDLVISQGFLRHFKDIKVVGRLVGEMVRVGKHVLIAEANTGGEVVRYVAEQLHTKVFVKAMVMRRVSLFVYLYDRYINDTGFKELVDSNISPGEDLLHYLSGLAGESLGRLYYFKL